jgi:hypothetical protein
MQFIAGHHSFLSSHKTYGVSLEDPNDWDLFPFEIRVITLIRV